MRAAPAATVPAAPRWFTLSAVAALAAYVGLFCALIVLTHEPRPTLDALDWIVVFLGTAAGDWWNYVWHPHNVHRIVFARLLAAADVELLHGSGLAFAVAGCIAEAALVFALLREWAVSDLPRAARAVGMAAVLLLFTATHIAVLVTVPTVTVFLHTVLFAVLAILLADGIAENPHPNLRLLLAIACAALAPFGLSGGLLIWPTLLWIAWRTGCPWRQIGMIALVGTVEWFVYLRDDAMVERIASDAAGALQFADYTIRLLGLPWSRAPALVWFGRSVGAAVLATGVWLVIRTTLPHTSPPRLQRIGAALILFASMTAAAVAVARGGIAEELPIRYAIFAALAQIGIVFAAAPAWPKHVAALRSPAVCAVALLVLLAFLAQQVASGFAAVSVTRRSAELWRQFAAGEWTPAMTTAIHPSRERAELALRLFRERRLYGFEPPVAR